LINNQQPMAPTSMYYQYSKTTPREMTVEDIQSVQDAFAAAAARAKEAGFEGIEIIASAGYLITQFLSPLKNMRTDQYGGTFENRLRFPQEVIAKVRKTIGPDMPLSVRMAGNDFVAGSNTDLETPKIARIYEAAGVDVINVTGGWHETKVPQLPMDVPRSAFSFLALNIKKAVSVPVMASNRIADPDTAEAIIRDGYADMVNLGRVLIADPQWPEKAFEGRKDEIRPCVACSQGCTDMVFQAQPVFCIGNPCAGYETQRKLHKTKTSKKVMVIGAGAAGLEAAVTAAMIGHDVLVYDRDSDIGGQLWIAGAPPHKRELLEFIRYYRAMIRKHQIKLNLNANVDAALIEKQRPDHIILAEGAKPLLPPIPGNDDPCVLSAWKVLKENPPLGKNVAVIGGGAVGLETALFIASKGTISPDVLFFLFAHEAEAPERLRELMFRGTSHVTVFEMLPQVGKDVGRSTRWVLFDNLKKYGVDIRPDTKVTRIENKTLHVNQNGSSDALNFDHVVLAAGSVSVNDLSATIKSLNIPYTVVGDCIKPGKINDAIHGGFSAAMNIEKGL
jgi:2,4-dienoyl-CoA reductase (NADPH2)